MVSIQEAFGSKRRDSTATAPRSVIPLGWLNVALVLLLLKSSRIRPGAELARNPALARLVWSVGRGRRRGAQRYTFTIDALDIDVKVGPRSEKLIELKSPKPGTYEFYCRITGHTEQMHATLTVMVMGTA